MTDGTRGRRRIRFEGQDTSPGPLSGHPRRAADQRPAYGARGIPPKARRRPRRQRRNFAISRILLVGCLALVLSVPAAFVYRAVNPPSQIAAQPETVPAVPSSSAQPAGQETVELEDDVAEEDPKEPPASANPKSSQAPAPKIPKSGPEKWTTAKFTASPSRKSGRLVRIRVRVEETLPISAEAAAKEAAAALHDKRSWQQLDNVRFEFIGRNGNADLTINIGTPDTTDKLCLPADTGGRLSCRNGNQVALNANRWVTGAKAYGNDTKNYRRYLINHEVGHYLGRGHQDCPGRGELAPLMMQQTKGVGQCKPNPWPNP